MRPPMLEYTPSGVIPAVLLPFHEDLSIDESSYRAHLRDVSSALLAFPPAIYTFGQRPEMALAHFKRIADATSLPLILFQYPLADGQGYPLATLTKILDEVPSVRAIKDWCANP